MIIQPAGGAGGKCSSGAPKKVDENASILDKIYPKIDWPKGKTHIAFFQNEKYFASSLGEALEVAEKNFGESAGFVLRPKNQEPAFFGCLYFKPRSDKNGKETI